MLKSGETQVLEFLVQELNKRGIRYKESLTGAINRIHKHLEDIYNKHRFDDNDFQQVSPAFQWAQSLTHIYIQIKFAHRHDSPGCLEVKNESVEIYKSLLVFKAYCVLGDVPIKFVLSLDLFDEVAREESIQKFGSVGRYQLTLKKKTAPMYWTRLLRNSDDNPHNMQVWWEMRSKFEDELQKYLDEDEENETRRQEEEIEKKTQRAKKRRERAAEKKRAQEARAAEQVINTDENKEAEQVGGKVEDIIENKDIDNTEERKDRLDEL